MVVDHQAGGAQIIPFLVALFPLSALADDTLVKFRGGIGVIPVASGVGLAPTTTVVNRNIVRGVQRPARSG